MKSIGFAVIAALLILGTLPLSADSSWEGTAAISRFGELPANGYFAASNSFPRNTKVRVTNSENGNSVSVTVTQGLDEPGIFILLSQKAAEDLRIGYTMSARVRVTPIQDDAVRERAFRQELPESRDPDLNPAAAVNDPLPPVAAPAVPAPVVPAPDSAPSSEPPEIALPADVPESPERTGDPQEVLDAPAAPVANTPEDSAAEPDAAPPEGPALVTEPIEEEPAPAVAGSNPLLEETPSVEPLEADPEPIPPAVAEPELGPVPAEDDVFAFAPEDSPEIPEEPELSEEIARESAPAEPDAPVEETGEDAMEEIPGEVIEDEPPLLAEEPPGEPEPPYPGLPEGTELTLIPAEPRPPAYSPEPEPASEPDQTDRIAEAAAGTPAEETAPPAPVEPAPPIAADPAPMEPLPPVAMAAPVSPDVPGLPVTTVLREDAFYLQVGVYASREMAEQIGGSLGTAYPMTLVPMRNGTRLVYRVLVGPFSEDEQGLILYQVRSRGYRDAFVRQGGD